MVMELREVQLVAQRWEECDMKWKAVVMERTSTWCYMQNLVNHVETLGFSLMVTVSY